MDVSYFLAFRAYISSSDHSSLITLDGATGFTGTLVAKYLALNAQNITWAISGRNVAKLTAVAEQLYGINPQLRGTLGILSDALGLNAVVRQATAGITTVGPFALHGEPFLRACIEEGTHYIDSTGAVAERFKLACTYICSHYGPVCYSGEFSWVKSMEVKYGALARTTGSIVVPMSGEEPRG